MSFYNSYLYLVTSLNHRLQKLRKFTQETEISPQNIVFKHHLLID